MTSRSRFAHFQGSAARLQAYRRLRLAQRELRETQAKLAKAGRLARLGELAAGLADDLVQPLTAVLGFAQRIRSLIEREMPGRMAEADLLLEGSRRMALVVERFRKIARPAEASGPDTATTLPAGTGISHSPPRSPR